MSQRSYEEARRVVAEKAENNEEVERKMRSILSLPDFAEEMILYSKVIEGPLFKALE